MYLDIKKMKKKAMEEAIVTREKENQAGREKEKGRRTEKSMLCLSSATPPQLRFIYLGVMLFLLPSLASTYTFSLMVTKCYLYPFDTVYTDDANIKIFFIRFVYLLLSYPIAYTENQL